MSYDQALERGAMALFGEKYGDQVRVLAMGGDYSVELCGGTHVVRTGDIGLFKLTAETGIAAGVRRIEAVTGEGAQALIKQADHTLGEISALLKGSRQDVRDRVASLIAENRQLSKALAEAEQQLAASQGGDLLSQVVDIDGVRFLAASLTGDNKAMMQTLDSLRSQLDNSVVVLAQIQGDKVGMVVAVSKSLSERVAAPDVLNHIGALVGVKGGGRPDLARAGGGDNPAGLDEAFAAAQQYVSQSVTGA